MRAVYRASIVAALAVWTQSEPWIHGEGCGAQQASNAHSGWPSRRTTDLIDGRSAI